MAGTISEYFNDDATAFLAHYGVLHKSGRYPWGSGENPHERNRQFLDYIADMKRQGMSETDIAKSFSTPENKLTTTQLRAAKSIANNEQKAARERQAMMLKEKGLSNVAIGERMKLPESSVRALLNPSNQAKTSQLETTASFLRDNVAQKGYIDVGAGVENHMGISQTQLKNAVALLREEGYKYYYVKVPQVTSGHETTIKVLAPADSKYGDVVRNPEKIQQITGYSVDNGKTYDKIQAPTNISSDRLQVNYKETGGASKDGVIELRRNVDDLSLGAARYAQVRIAVDGTHYLKGMAMYADDLPKGVDIRFNTNKSDTGNKLDALKGQKNDPDDPNPFGSVIRQVKYTDKDGNEKLSPLNIVNEEGRWNDWSTNLSSQVLSKQSTTLAKRQLDLVYKTKVDELDEIMHLSNPTVKKKLLQSFADDADSSAEHLKAAGLPRQRTQVILPITTMKENEVYAPNFRNGEKVALIRYPHGGTFEIPELTVNNKQPDANRLIKNAADAIGIHPNIAERLSGADFDGDTVLVIPNDKRQIKSTPPLKKLEGFDPKTAYPAYEGMKVLTPRAKQIKMGDVSNLITDMTVKGAPHSDIAKAVKHSMVIIDAEKHKLNWKQSYLDNGIADLKTKYQTGPKSGATTLISRASSPVHVPERKQGYRIDPDTGRKIYTPTGNEYVIPAHEKVSPKKGIVSQVPEETVARTTKSTRMAETHDARTLISDADTPIENVYADHANRLKALGNEARKSFLQTPSLTYHSTANKAYKPQVDTLNAKLNIALKNAPTERQAQIVANVIAKAKIEANPDMDAADVKKVKGRALRDARERVGAGKKQIVITDDEWAAIQAGAITNNKLTQILNNADIDKVKSLATPRTALVMTTTKVARAKAMANSGYTQSEIADALGVSTSTVNDALSGKG